jgi:hypothetical protein
MIRHRATHKDKSDDERFAGETFAGQNLAAIVGQFKIGQNVAFAQGFGRSRARREREQQNQSESGKMAHGRRSFSNRSKMHQKSRIEKLNRAGAAAACSRDTLPPKLSA